MERGLKVVTREDLNALTPRLRRYARALLSGHPGGCERADDLVHAALIRTLGARSFTGDPIIGVYATLTQLHREAARGQARPATYPPSAMGGRTSAASAVVRQSRLTLGLMGLPLEERETLLLVALEGFHHDEVARILHVSRATVLGRLTRARSALEGQLRLASDAAPMEPMRRAPHLRVIK